MTFHSLARLEEFVRRQAVEDGLVSDAAAPSLRVVFDGHERVRRPDKDWNACPYTSHADDCNCGGAGGDR